MRKTSTAPAPRNNSLSRNRYADDAAMLFDVDLMYFEHYMKTSPDMSANYKKMEAEDKDWCKRLFTALFRNREDHETLTRLRDMAKFAQVRRLCAYDPFYSMLMTWLLFREVRVPEKRAQQKQKERNKQKKKQSKQKQKMQKLTPEQKQKLKEEREKRRQEKKDKGEPDDGEEDGDSDEDEGDGDDSDGDGDQEGDGDDSGDQDGDGDPQDGSDSAGKGNSSGKGVDQTDGLDADDIDPDNTDSFGTGDFDDYLDEDLAEELKQEIQDILNSSRVSQDLDKAAEQEAMVRSFSREGNKEKNLMDPERIMQIYNRMNSNANFQKILNIMGGLMAAYGKALRMSYLASNNNIVDVVQGNDLRKLLKTEFQALGHPKLNRIAKLRFIQKSMLQYKMENNQEANRGPIAIFMDVSGSMDAHFQGATRVEWAWAMLLAIAKISEDEGREVRIFTFDTTITEIEFKDFRDLLLTGKYHTGGGTSISECFKGFWQKCDKKFDLVMLSDLEDHLDDTMKAKIIEARTKTDSKYHLFLINDQTNVSRQWMQAFNTVVPVTSSPDAMEQFMVEATKKDNMI